RDILAPRRKICPKPSFPSIDVKVFRTDKPLIVAGDNILIGAVNRSCLLRQPVHRHSLENRAVKGIPVGVILKCGAVFLHIPKTGGSWVEQALRACGQVHRFLPHRHADMTRVMHYKKFQKFRPRFWIRDRRIGMPESPMLGATYRFCFVRNPLKWYES